MTRDKLIELAQVGMGIHSPNQPEYIVCEALIKALEELKQKPISNNCWPTAAIGRETLQDAIERERAVGYREGHRAALAQRTWVGLTDAEIKLKWSEFWETDCHAWSIEFAKAIEAKLKEKNT